jgi:hypothetical protein
VADPVVPRVAVHHTVVAGLAVVRDRNPVVHPAVDLLVVVRVVVHNPVVHLVAVPELPVVPSVLAARLAVLPP